MKKSRAVLLSLITLLCLAFGIFAVACGETENNDDGDTTTYYTVTLSYDSDKGTVTKSDPASSKGYVKDETVTITVSPKEEYKVSSVKENDTVLDVGTDGKYTFKVAGDTTVTVTFEDDTPAPSVTYYTVTLEYDAEKGTVKKSDPAAADGYVKDETVTLTVTPAENYIVDSVKIGDTALTAGADGKYTFTVTDNTTVTVTFKDAPKPSENALLLDEKYYGTYHDMADADKSADIVVSSLGVFWGEDEVLLEEDVDAMGNYTVTVGDDAETLYGFKANDDGTIFLFSFDFSVDKTFLKDGVKLSFTVSVTVVGDETWGTATLSPEKPTYEQGEQVTLTVTPAEGYLVDRVSVDFDSVSLENGTTYTFNVTKNTDISVYFKKDIPISAEFQGEWKNIADNADTLTIADKTITWNGHTVTVDSIDEYGFTDPDTFEPVTLGISLTLTIDGTDRIVVTLYNGADAFNLSWYEFSEDFMTPPTEHAYYFVKGDGRKVAADDLAAGSFKQLGADPQVTLTVAEDGSVTLGDQAAKVYYTGENYLVVVGGTAYLVNIANANYLTAAEIGAAEPATLSFLRDEFTVKPYALIVGEWTGENGEKLTVNENGTATLTGVDGVSDTNVTLLASSSDSSAFLVKTADGYEVAEFSGDYSEGKLNYYLMGNVLYVALSKVPDTLTLGEDWYSAYAYSGDDLFPPFQKFVVNANGLGFVNRFNVLIDGSYVYGAALSATEYMFFVVDEWDGVTYYSLTLDAEAGTITIVDSEGDEYVYNKTELQEIENFKVTLSFDDDRGSATLNGQMAESDGKTYYIEKTEGTESYSFTLSVNANPGFAVDTVKIGEDPLSDNGNGTYSFTADGTAEVTVVITFKDAPLEPLVIEDTSYHGTTWSSESTEKKLTIDENGVVKFDGEDIYILEELYNGYTVRIGTKTWTFAVDDHGISLYTTDFTEEYYFTKDGGSTSTTYSVTVAYGNDPYDAAMGSAVADKDSYSAGDVVTLTVTVGTGYSIETVTANSEALQYVSAEGNVYTFTFEITEDTNVIVTFASVELPPELTIDEVWAGDWKSVDGNTAFSITATSAAVTVNGSQSYVTAAESTEETLTLTAGDKTYSFTWYEGYIVHKVMILTEGEETHYFIPNGDAIDTTFTGTWYDQYGTNILVIDAAIGAASFNGKSAVAIADCGYQTTVANNDGTSVTINHNCLYLIMEDGGDIYFIGWYRDTTTAGQANGRTFDNPTVTTPDDCETPLTHTSFIELYVDADLNGSWRNVKNDITIVIDSTAKTVKVNGTDAEIYNNGGTRGAGNILVIDGTTYRFEPDPGYNYYATRETVVELGMGKRDYFLRSDHDFLKIVNTNLQGTEWADLSKTHKLSIDAEGNLKYDNVTYTIFVAELLDNSSYKVIAFSEDNLKVELTLEQGADSLKVSDGFTEVQFYKNTGGGEETQAGFLGLPIGTYHDANNATVEVTADSLIIKVKTFDYYDDEDITVTQEMLFEADPVYGSSKHYTFQWTDATYGNEHTMHIALDVSVSWMGGDFSLMIGFSEITEYFFLQK